VATPASVASFFEEEIALAEQLAPALAGGKKLHSDRIEQGGSLYLVFSGPGAANLARALRDEARVKFKGRAGIPEERGLS
jgi:hypothetical protein